MSRYHHNDTGEDDADAHIKRQLMGREVVVAVNRGLLAAFLMFWLPAGKNSVFREPPAQVRRRLQRSWG